MGLNPTNLDQITNLDQALDKFVNLYNGLNKENLATLSEIYTDDVTFIDPLHELHGLDTLAEYFSHLYENLVECEFKITERFYTEDNAAIYWQMSYAHSKINSGRLIKVQGHSQLKFVDGKVKFHRDYFDLGAMLYENLPLIGAAIRLIKTKASS